MSIKWTCQNPYLPVRIFECSHPRFSERIWSDLKTMPWAVPLSDILLTLTVVSNTTFSSDWRVHSFNRLGTIYQSVDSISMSLTGGDYTVPQNGSVQVGTWSGTLNNHDTTVVPPTVTNVGTASGIVTLYNANAFADNGDFKTGYITFSIKQKITATSGYGIDAERTLLFSAVLLGTDIYSDDFRIGLSATQFAAGKVVYDWYFPIDIGPGPLLWNAAGEYKLYIKTIPNDFP